MYSINFLGRLGKYPIGPLFFLLAIFFVFSFSFSFQFLSMLFIFSFVFLLLIFNSLIFLLFSSKKKSFVLFHVVSLFSFVECSKSVATLQDSMGKSAHSELALFALYWLVVTFPCGMVHILVMIRLRVVFGGWRVGQVLPSYQNRQISALDETADAPQSNFFSLLSFVFSLHLSSINTYLSSPDSIPHKPLAGRSRVFPERLPFFFWEQCTF